jgi:hypothetical protein
MEEFGNPPRFPEVDDRDKSSVQVLSFEYKTFFIETILFFKFALSLYPFHKPY